MSGLKRTIVVLVMMLAVITLLDVVALAQGASGSYRIDESFIGPGSNLESNSSNFTTEGGQGVLGSTGAVKAESDNFQTDGGPVTSGEPTLSFELDAFNVDFGAFSPAATETATASFRVKNYTSYGYNVTLIGPPPKMGDYELTPLSNTSPSEVGVEQFGINLAANTDPIVFGSFPIQHEQEGEVFSYGDATANYSSPNVFRYIEGETIASAAESSGETGYTISYIINVSNNTPGGTYSTTQVVLCTGRY